MLNTSNPIKKLQLHVIFTFINNLIFSILTVFKLGGGGGGVDAIQELNPYYSRAIVFTVFLLRDFSSNLAGNNLTLAGFGS